MRFSASCWPQLTGIFLLAALSIPCALLLPVPLKIAVDSVIGSQPLPSFLRLFGRRAHRPPPPDACWWPWRCWC